MPVFIGFALARINFFTLLMQSLFLGISVLFFSFSLRGMRWRAVLSIVPLLLFIFVFNSFRGGGEIVLRAGPVMIMRQGVERGFYYSLFVLELFFMSNFLTRSFSEDELVSVLFTMKMFSRGKRSQDSEERAGLALMLFYVLKIFHSAYRELRIFFKKSSRSFRERALLFVHTLFMQAMRDFESHPIEPGTMKPRFSDALILLVQFLFLFCAVLIERSITV